MGAVGAVTRDVGEGIVLLAPVCAPQAGPAGQRGFLINMFAGQFFDKAAGDRTDPLAIDAAIGGVQDDAAPPRPGDRDIGEAAFFFEAGQPAFVNRALRWEYAFFPADAEDIVEFQPLGRVDCHDRHRFLAIGAVIIHDEADVFEEIAERLVILHRAREFGKVFHPASAFGRAIRGEHGVIAAFLQHQPQQIGGRHRLCRLTPMQELPHQGANGVCRARGQFIAVGQLQCGGSQRQVHRPRVAVHFLQRLGTQSTLGLVMDAFKREVILRLRDQPKIGEGIADFGAFVKTETANDAVIHPDLDEAVFKLAGLVLRAHQNGDAVERRAFAFQPLDLLAHPARFFGRVPHADHPDLVTAVHFRPQRLVVALAVRADQPRCRAENMRG